MALDAAFCSNSGNDTTGTGTQLNPYATPLKASQNVNPNGTVYSRGGTYTNIGGAGNSGDTFYALPNGTGSSFTTVKAYDGEPVIYQIKSGVVAMINVRTGNARQSFEDIEWVGQGYNYGTPQVCFRVIPGQSGSFMRLLRCTVRQFSNQGVLTSNCSDFTFNDNIIRDCGRTDANQYHGYYISSGSVRIEIARNTIFNISGHGIHHYGTGQASACRYHDNEIYNFGIYSGSGLLVANGDGNWIWNNVVRDGHGNSGYGYDVEYNQGGSTTLFRNGIHAHNLAYNCPQGGFRFNDANSTSLCINNIALGNGGTPITNAAGVVLTTNLTTGSPASIWSDPVTLKNFHLLAAASAALGQGTYNSTFPTDRDGRTRSDPPDLGPFNFLDFTPAVFQASNRRRMIVVPQLAGFR